MQWIHAVALRQRWGIQDDNEVVFVFGGRQLEVMLPSLWDDPYPTAMLEAAAAGLPIVAAARGGITEFLHGCPHLDFVPDPGNPHDLALAMERLATHAGHRAEAGRWLRAIIEAHFDWSRVSADFEALYDQLLPASNLTPAS